MRAMKRMGFSDAQLGDAARRAGGERPCASVAGRSACDRSYKMVDTCAGEFPSSTPYLYSTLRRGERGAAIRPNARS